MTGAAAKKAADKKGLLPANRQAKAAAKPKGPRKTTAPVASCPARTGRGDWQRNVARTEVIKKLWDYIKANGLQDAANKRAINADAKLLPCSASPR
jgi:DNA topoisomerase-3